MTDTSDMLGPIDYLVVEFPGNKFNGQILPALTRLIAHGTVRVLDLAFVTKDADGVVSYGEIEDLDDDEVGSLKGLSAFLADVVSEEDLAVAAAELSPNSSAALIVWENTWAAPFAHAVRGSGGELIASGRLPASAVLDLLANTAS
ncbi:MAG TPA: DUF6325 family protein [Acidimicrobiales bacterium]|nr:DUF6325 family protein [Acidimicrobiales bacterium]